MNINTILLFMSIVALVIWLGSIKIRENRKC